jgi:hypothetical protein
MVAPVLNYALRHEDVWGRVRTDPHFLHLGTSTPVPTVNKVASAPEPVWTT